MADSITKPNQFTIQNQASPPTRQPLELRHLSHDLRGPLNSILGFSELLLEGIEGPLNDTQSEDILAMRHSAKNLLRLISIVVDLSKLAADELSLDFADVSLYEVLQKVQQTVKHEASIEFEVDLSPSMPLLFGDASRIEQIIINVIHFLIQKEKVQKISGVLNQNSTDATLQIIASNLFIPTSEIEEFFELTVSVDSNGHSKLTHGGLELPLAQQLAAKQNGRLWVESKEETGTVFFLSLPLSASN